MTREEVQDYLAMMQAAYPNYNPPSRTAAVNVWTMALAEYDKEDVAIAFKFYLQTNSSGFAPSVGQLIDKIHIICNPQELNELEAWTLVSDAIKNSAYNSIEEFAKLPPAVQKAVGQSMQLREWALTENLNREVVMSSFQRAYRAEITRKRELLKMSSDVRKVIEKSSYKSQKAQIEAKNKQKVELIENKKKELGTKTEVIQMPEHLKQEFERWKKEDTMTV